MLILLPSVVIFAAQILKCADIEFQNHIAEGKYHEIISCNHIPEGHIAAGKYFL